MYQLILILLIPTTAFLLVSAQALWRTSVVEDRVFEGSFVQTLINFLQNPKIWLGAGLYLITTVIYLYLFTKFKFFVVQMGVTGLALIFTTFISYYVFHEKISLLNLVGLILILFGVILVAQK